MENLLKKIDALNDIRLEEFTPFFIGDVQVGRIHISNLVLLDTTLFVVSDSKVVLDPNLLTKEARTAKVHEFNLSLKKKGIFPKWRDEKFNVLASFGSNCLMLIERSTTTFYGMNNYGVHINGFVVKDNTPMMWIATRSLRKQTFPGLYDNIVAGGLTAGYSVRDIVIKECFEEAKIDEELAQKALPTSTISYLKQRGTTSTYSTVFIYDLELPSDFVPTPNDGEVDSFHLMSYDEVLSVISNTNKFKDNCDLVIIDFMIRHGSITPDMDGYVDLIKKLRM